MSKIGSASGVATAIKVAPDPMGMTLTKTELPPYGIAIGKEGGDADKIRFEVGWQEYTDS